MDNLFLIARAGHGTAGPFELLVQLIPFAISLVAGLLACRETFQALLLAGIVTGVGLFLAGVLIDRRQARRVRQRAQRDRTPEPLWVPAMEPAMEPVLRPSSRGVIWTQDAGLPWLAGTRA